MAILKIIQGMVDAVFLPLAGGTLTGALTLSGAPTVDLHAATKKYVDDNAGGTVSVLSKTSGTSIDLAGVDVVHFAYGAPATISTYTNVTPGKLYAFVNHGGSAITIDRTGAYMDGSTNAVLDTEDVALMIGRSATTLRQAAGETNNG